MKNIKHPREYIAPELVAAIQNTAAEAELLKQLHNVQLAIIQEQQWFQLFVPKAYGGLELTLPEALQLEEALAWADGSVGWTVTLCAGAGWFIGFLDSETATNFFYHKAVCLAGSGKATGIAKITADGYEITGQWDYATGANHATAFTANCMIEKDGELLKNRDGSTQIKPFIFFSHEVKVSDNWKRIGMIATGSNRFEVDQLVVNANRAFAIDPQQAVLKQPVYQYQFLQLAETTLAVNSSGMAMRFLDLCKIIFDQQISGNRQSSFENAILQMENARSAFYAAANDSWIACMNDRGIAASILQQVSNASRQLAVTSRMIVDELYPLCGMQAANPDTEINRVWRNLHTASQHSIFNS